MCNDLHTLISRIRARILLVLVITVIDRIREPKHTVVLIVVVKLSCALDHDLSC